MKDQIEPIITEFKAGTNWCGGTFGNLRFEAKLFDKGSTFGIGDGRVSVLSIWDPVIVEEKQNFHKGCLVIFDRAWFKEPDADQKEMFDSIINLLVNLPKRFDGNFVEDPKFTQIECKE